MIFSGLSLLKIEKIGDLGRLSGVLLLICKPSNKSDKMLLNRSNKRQVITLRPTLKPSLKTNNMLDGKTIFPKKVHSD